VTVTLVGAEFANQSMSTSVVVPYPTGWAPNDLLVILTDSDDTALNGGALPDGWADITANVVPGFGSYRLMVRAAESDDSGEVTVDGFTAPPAGILIVALRGVNLANGEVDGFEDQTSGTDLSGWNAETGGGLLLLSLSNGGPLTPLDPDYVDHTAEVAYEGTVFGQLIAAAYWIPSLGDESVPGGTFANPDPDDYVLIGLSMRQGSGLDPPPEWVSRVSASLHTTDGTPVADLSASFARSWQEVHNGVGSATVSIPADDADAALIDLGQCVTFSLDDTPRFTMLVEAIEAIVVAQGEEHDQIVVASGRGWSALMERAVVYPSGGAGRIPFADDRLFGIISPEFARGVDLPYAERIKEQTDTAAPWVLPDATAAPAEWPEGAGPWWIWGTALVDDAHDVGVCYFHRTYDIDSPGKRVLIYASGDDRWTLYLNNVPILGDATNEFAWRETRWVSVFLDEGLNVFSAEVENVERPVPGPGGLLVAIFDQESDGTRGDIVAFTDDNTGGFGWHCSAYPDPVPGFTAGELVALVMAEADDRGVTLGITVDFTDTDDSASNPWPEIPTIAIPIGTSLLGVLDRLAAAGHIDWCLAPGPDSCVLSMWLAGGRGSASGVAFTAGTNITALEWRT
jgi:hypothetical protein